MTAGDIEDSYPLAPMQRAMLSDSMASKGSGSYIQQKTCELRERVDARLLERAWRSVCLRHTALRTAFRIEGIGEPMQDVHRVAEIAWTHADWTGLAPAEREARFDLHAAADRQCDFDPTCPPLMRLALFRFSESHSRLLWTHHHALLDGRAARIVLRDVFDLYDAYAAGRELALPAAPPYRDHIDWLARQDATAARDYWQRALAGHAAPTTLAEEFPQSGGNDAPERYAAHEIRLTAGAADALQTFARDRRLTLNTLVLGAWAQLLGRYTGEDEVSFGAVVTLRSAGPAALRETVGLLINTVPLRIGLPPRMPLVDWLRALRTQLVAVRPHSWAPLTKIRQWGGIPRENALFSTLVAYENAPLGATLAAERPGWTTRAFDGKAAPTHPVTLVAFGGVELSLKIVYRRTLFQPASIAAMLNHLRTLLEGAILAPERPLADQPMLTDAERTRLLVEWNDTGRTFPDEACVHRLFERQAGRTPDAVAVESETRTLSYRELDERSNRLAHRLRHAGIATGALVGLYLARSSEVIVAMLGIMKAGAAYVPLDADNPPQRIAYLIADARLATIVTTAALARRLDGFPGHVVCIDGHADGIAEESTVHIPDGAALDDLAYAVYTSGSTGGPKGILVTHRALANHTLALRERYAFGPADRRLQFVSIGSDVLIAEVFPVLLAGGTLVLRPDAGLLSIADFLRFLEERRITVAGLPSAYWHEWATAMAAGTLPFPSSLRVVISGMDRARPDLLAVWKRNVPRGVRWFNAYGPSETTCTAANYEADLASDETPSTVPIGRPLPNVRIHILDAHDRLVPIGVRGEICIGGRGVARGYLNRPELTAEKFVADPFSDDPSSRLYRSGDTGRHLPDGNIEFLGRVDDQVKIRGFRVEPAEVEAAVRRLPGVRDACVVVRGATAEARRLVAYVVAAADAQLVAADLRFELRRSLPDYMVPTAIVPIVAIPLTIAGKIDHGALPEAGAGDVPDARRLPAPEDSLESALTAIWEALLGVRVDAADNFFDLGGDSLRGVQLLNAVHAEFGVDVPLAALFDDAATVATMASRISAERRRAPSRAGVPTIPRRSGDAAVPLSSTQAGAWFLQRLDASGVAYNEARLWQIDGALDVGALRAALAIVATRQSMLRTRFVTIDGQPRQVVDAAPIVDLEEVDVPAGAGAARQRLDAEVLERATRRFDLARATPLRWTLFRLGPGRFALLRVAHHILSDATSARILHREISAAYAAVRAGRDPALPPLAIDYADFAAWQAREYAGPDVLRRLAFWKSRLADLPVLALPADFRRPPAQSFRGDEVAIPLPCEAAAALKAVARAQGASPFVAYLAAFTALVSRLSGDTDLPIGTPVAGRTLPELAHLVGFFANTVVLRAELSGTPDTRELLSRTRDTVRDALLHQDAPFDKVVEAVGMPRDPSRNPLFQVAFAMWESDVDDLAFAGAYLQRLDTHLTRAKFDLTVTVIERPDRTDLRWEYCTDLFLRTTIEQMSRQYATLVEAMGSHPGTPVAALPLMDDATADGIVRAAIGVANAYPATLTIPQRFALQAEASPGARAIGSLDYAGLDAAANRLARELRLRGVTTGAVVAVARRESADVAIAWLAVLKAGGAYLPVDPDLPPAFVAHMLADARVAHAIADDALAALLGVPGVRVVCPDRDAESIAGLAPDVPESGARPDDPAYVMYTSGSAGIPKGVVIPHRAVLRLVCDTDCAQLGAADAVAQLANPAFDASTFEFWGALLNGARIVPIARTVAIAPRALAAALASEHVSVLFLTTALFNAIARDVPDAFRTCRCVLFGGEAVEPRWVAEVLRAGPPGRLLHVYGPTETTTFATWQEVRDVAPNAATIPIGSALANTEVFVLRADGAVAAPGEPGEIWIGGPGLALGYLNPGPLDADRFVTRPVGRLPARRLYRSGDHARVTADGAIVFVGRRDRQVKVRGHRIELDEVEAAIARLPHVRAAVVALRGETTDTRALVAYLVAADASARPPAGLWHDLRRVLPEYMLPGSILWLKSLPLNANGKVDRRALPAAASSGVPAAGAHVAPRDMFEQLLVGIWQRLLDVAEIGVFDHFFEIGGHSLLAARLFDDIERETGLTAPLAALFVDDTIAGLAQALRESPAALAAPIIAVNAGGTFPPLAFLHGDLTGGGFYCRSLARSLGPDQPVLIVQPHGLDSAPIPDTIEAMAADRIHALRALRPHGPYLLGGYCNGALVAYEMARQLIAQGEPVPLVIVIEAVAPGGGAAGDGAAGDRYVTFDRDGGIHVLAAHDRATEAQLRYSQAIDRYAGGPYAGRLVLVRSRAVRDARRDLGWARFAASVELHVLPGDHVTLVTRHVDALAQVLRAALDRLLARAT